MTTSRLSPRQQLVHYVQELERLAELKKQASDTLNAGFKAAKAEGYDPTTLKVVLKLRKMTAEQRQERRALESIYMAALGMLEGDPLTEEARRRLDGQPVPPPPPPEPGSDTPASDLAPPAPPVPEQQPLIVKDPAEARQEGAEAAAAGKRIYDNPYRAGDPCRAAWDEGWCATNKSHGMETPAAYQRRTDKPAEPRKPGDGDGKPGHP